MSIRIWTHTSIILLALNLILTGLSRFSLTSKIIIIWIRQISLFVITFAFEFTVRVTYVNCLMSTVKEKYVIYFISYTYKNDIMNSICYMFVNFAYSTSSSASWTGTWSPFSKLLSWSSKLSSSSSSSLSNLNLRLAAVTKDITWYHGLYTANSIPRTNTWTSLRQVENVTAQNAQTILIVKISQTEAMGRPRNRQEVFLWITPRKGTYSTEVNCATNFNLQWPTRRWSQLCFTFSCCERSTHK